MRTIMKLTFFPPDLQDLYLQAILFIEITSIVRAFHSMGAYGLIKVTIFKFVNTVFLDYIIKLHCCDFEFS